jgi:glucose/mannose-6-phosphate isomerase
VTLDDPRLFEGRDPHRVRDILARFPAQCRAALALAPVPAFPHERPALVVVAGMGGSAAGGELLAACAAERVDVPILVHRGYGLPAAAGPRALVLASSYSGETAEVLSAAEAALARRVPLAILTSGGQLAALAAERRLPLVRLPEGLVPRMALGYLFVPVVRLLGGLGLSVASDAELGEAVAVLDRLAADLAPEQPATANEAKRLAQALDGRMPAIYGGSATGPVAQRWRTDLEENAKVLAVAGALPEMNHNEIEAWRAPAARALHLVLLRDADESPDLARRFAILRELVGSAAGGVSECWTRGASRAARLLALAYVGMWVSYYLAVARGVDPWSTPLLDEVKRRLRSSRAYAP